MPLAELITPLTRGRTLGADVHAQLRELLTSGGLRPGEVISLRTTALALGVSVMPVREAVYQLVAERALEITSNRSIRVPILKAAQFREITAIRIQIESMAVKEVAHTRTPDVVAELRDINSLLKREMLAPAPAAAELMRHNRAFHFAIYRAADMPVLFDMIESLWLRIGPVLGYDLWSGSDNVRKGTAFRLHDRLIKALEAADGEAAASELRADLQCTAEHILAAKVLPEG